MVYIVFRGIYSSDRLALVAPGGFLYFGTKLSFSWCILSIIGGNTMKKVFKQIKYMKDCRQDLFEQFLFGITMAFLGGMQTIALLLYLYFVL